MTNEFLHRELSEKEKVAIKKRAKKIMDSFESKLSEIKQVKQESVLKKEFERKEGEPCKKEINREIMFENASKKNKDFIIAEKKNW